MGLPMDRKTYQADLWIEYLAIHFSPGPRTDRLSLRSEEGQWPFSGAGRKQRKADDLGFVSEAEEGSHDRYSRDRSMRRCEHPKSKQVLSSLHRALPCTNPQTDPGGDTDS